MKSNYPWILLVIVAALLSQECTRNQKEISRDYPLAPVDFTEVKLQEGFWKDWVETVHDATIRIEGGEVPGELRI